MSFTLTYVSSKYPLTKTISTKKVDPYPLVKELTSHEDEVTTIEEFYASLIKHSHQGHALMKGPFMAPLFHESRADATDKAAPTQWMCLDFDGFQGNLDEVLNGLKLAEVSYIVQYSASQGFKPGLSAHIFMILEAPITPGELKRWLQWQNLECKPLKDLTELNKANTALKYKLDIVTADNTRMLFISPPNFIDKAVDPLPPGSRIQLVTKALPTAALGTIPTEIRIRRRVQARIASLLPAELQHLAKSIWQRATEIDEDVLVPTRHAQITGIKKTEEFTYLNLNGGDSWGYYFRTNNPEFLYNFKGEPTYRMKDIVPELVDANNTTEIFIGYDDEQYIIYHKKELHTAKTWGGAQSVCNSLKIPIPNKNTLCALRLTYAPSQKLGFFAGSQGIQEYNTYIPGKIIAKSDVPWPIIKKTVQHVCVDQVTYQHFMNWLYFIFQLKRKTKTAWIFTGVPGTGKGVVIDSILKPLIGESNMVTVSKDVLESSFNNYVTGNLFAIYDEAKYTYGTDRAIDHKLKILITGDSIQMNSKHAQHRMVESHSNVLITSNEYEVAKLSSKDRRYNVAPRQETPINKRYPGYADEYELIAHELPGFLHHLETTPFDAKKASMVLETESRRQMIDMNKWDVEQVVDQLHQGNLPFFQSAVTEVHAGSIDALQQSQYNKLIARFETEDTSDLNLADLRLIFKVFTNVQTSAHAVFSRALVRANLLKRIDRISVIVKWNKETLS